MASLSPTADIERELAEADPSDTFRYQWIEGRLAKAKVRDVIQATRPEGCQCLGAGYVTGRLPSAFCDCPEGQVERAKWIAERNRQREERRAAAWAAAGVPARFEPCTIENFPDQSRKGYDRVKWWVEGPDWPEDQDDPPEGMDEWEKRKESLLIHGTYGTGKTGLATGVLRELIREHGSGLFLTVPSLLDRIRSTYDGKSDDRELLEQVQTTPVLLLDDLGAERVTDWVAEKLFTVINARHDDLLTTVFTSNLDPKQLAAHIGERIAWRVVEMCEIVKLDGPNLRDR